ncbi:nucleic acid dioxygenase ALKBH1-like [Sycon ciliatum]|uniref:nucleic acid dioxygenase ALKBH1-like n=1 Tax=Sycon ciliatum TaxID=27933 RepID=UPI0031F718C8
MAEGGESACSSDLFKEEFKRYKRRKPAPNFSDVIDFTKSSSLIKEHSLDQDSCSDDVTRQLCSNCGLRSVESWKIFQVPSHPGFYYIVDPFKDGFHRHWVKQCLSEYPHLPNVSNLDAHLPGRPSDLWQDALHQRQSDHAGWLSSNSLIQRLRWVTLGYHYDWTNKVYYKEKVSPVAADVDELCGVMARVLKFDEFKAEAGIVNFYHLDSTLSGHTDHSEFDLTAPLFSISFGQDAIFLLGGHERSARPVAMMVRSGDAMVMSGEARMAYHAVPRVFPTTVKPLEVDSIVSDDEWTPYGEYMHASRVNLNIRQVLRPGEGFPDVPYPTACTAAAACSTGETHGRVPDQCASSGTAQATASAATDVTGSLPPSNGLNSSHIAHEQGLPQSPNERTTHGREAAEPSCKRRLVDL